MKFPPASDIRKLRKTADVTQQELAHESGISQSTIAKIERGKISASYETVVRLFETLENIGQGRRSERTASDVSSKHVVTVQSADPVHMAIEMMRATGYSQLPVLDGDSPVGSISERGIFDMVRKGKTLDDLKDSPISAVMGESFPVVSEGTPLSSVTAVMNESNAVLVARKGKVVGMITNADMLKLI